MGIKVLNATNELNATSELNATKLKSIITTANCALWDINIPVK